MQKIELLFHSLYSLNPNQLNVTTAIKAKRMSSRIEQSLSLMIPRVFPQWIDEQKIIDVFHKQQIGRVYKVSIIRMPDSKKRRYPIYQAFVYFSAWYDNDIAYHFQQRIFGPRAQARVVYDDPWYWVAFENTKRHLSNNDKRIMRLGYQAYVNECTIENLTDRIRELEYPEEPSSTHTIDAVDAWPATADAWPKVPENHLNWNLNESFVMNTLGQELNLTETAISVAESALQEEVSPMDISFNDVCEKGSNEMSWLSYQQSQLEKAAEEVLGVELAMAETAISVAEAVFENEYKDYFEQERQQANHDKQDKWEEKMDEDYDETYCCRACEFYGRCDYNDSP